ncbi:MAG: CoA transferase [Solirubrobacterales bacterium]|nr:CoA transferase [Solirubrobacterales bacterium]
MTSTPRSEDPPGPDKQDSALEGLRVADFSRVLAGPFATMILGDLGADVVKIERPGSGDDTRAWLPPQDEHGVATYFLSVNRNKVSQVVDLRDPDGQEEARRLIADSDILVENFRVGLMDSLGLGYEALKELNPGLIYCSITGFGDGEGRAMPGYDLLAQAVGGLMSITGGAGEPPRKVGVAMVDVLAGLFAGIGILAALRHRDATGEGQRVDINLLSSLLASLVNQSAAYTAGGVVAGRMGNDHPSIAPYSAYAAADGDLVLAVGNDRQFRDLCEELGVPDLADDDRYRSNELRVSNRDSLRDQLELHLRERPVDHWTERLARVRVPAGRVNDIGEAFRLASDLGLDPIVTVGYEDGGQVRLPASPIRLSRTPARYRRPPARVPGQIESER